jgi:hypothetical protein
MEVSTRRFSLFSLFEYYFFPSLLVYPECRTFCFVVPNPGADCYNCCCLDNSDVAASSSHICSASCKHMFCFNHSDQCRYPYIILTNCIELMAREEEGADELAKAPEKV